MDNWTRRVALYAEPEPVIISSMNSLKQIKEALAVGADDYLVRPHDPFQLRSRALVGMRWLSYIDSLFEGKSGKK
ncbi:MAG: hypothetical protein ABI651_12585 [Verrucomicrobiota bacterium]